MARWHWDELYSIPRFDKKTEKSIIDFNEACEELGIDFTMLTRSSQNNNKKLTTFDERQAIRYIIQGKKIPNDLKDRLLKAKKQRELQS